MLSRKDGLFWRSSATSLLPATCTIHFGKSSGYNDSVYGSARSSGGAVGRQWDGMGRTASSVARQPDNGGVFHWVTFTTGHGKCIITRSKSHFRSLGCPRGPGKARQWEEGSVEESVHARLHCNNGGKISYHIISKRMRSFVHQSFNNRSTSSQQLCPRSNIDDLHACMPSPIVRVRHPRPFLGRCTSSHRRHPPKNPPSHRTSS